MFKKISKKPVRVRKDSDEEHSDGEDMNKDEFEKTRELQKLRKRAAGTNIETLGSGKKQNVAEDDDPLGLKKGGMMDVKAMKNYKKEDDAYDVGTQFSKETHIRDEDDEMRKFIETEMSKVKGGAPQPEAEEDNTEEFLSPEDAALMSLPEHLTRSTFKKDQQMISAQMLTGIPEVDLGIDVKIQNIERTERAKKKLLEESKVKGVGLETATNYVQHDRWKDVREIEMVRDEGEKKTQQPVKRPNTVNIYSQEDDLILKSDRRLQGDAKDEEALNRFKKVNTNR